VLLTAVHTHTGPSVGLDDAARDGVPAAEAMKIAAYTRRLQEHVVEAVAQAGAALEPAELAWGSGVAHFVMNRREWTPDGGVRLGANPRGLADRSVPVLRVGGPDGKPRALLFQAAVHNTTLTGNCYDICGDYAGFAQYDLQERYPGVQAMFMLGCAGDADPYPRGTMEIAREHGKTLGKEVARVLDGRLQPVRGPLRTAYGKADLPLEAPPSRADMEAQAAGRGVGAWVAQQMLAVLARGEALPTHYPAPFAVWQFGDDLTLVALSGEVVVDYVPLLEQALGPNRLWVGAYAHEVFGYLPSARVLREGGYETRGLYAGGIGYFTPETERVVIDHLRELARRAGRPLPDDR
jgi:neutral ceramidase